jgi:hypothetical protein
MKIKLLQDWNEYRAKATVEVADSIGKQLVKQGIAVDPNASKAKAVKHGVQ